jgi:iron complex outermembrane receptor protein
MIPDFRYRGTAFPRRSARRHCLFLLGIPLTALFLATGAMAQTVNYGSLEQLFGEPVTTSATGQPQRVTEVPAAMEIVPAEQIRRSGAVDIPGVLKHVPGLDLLQWSTDGADIGVRGYNQVFSPRLLVLIDGRQVYADHYGYTPWMALPVELQAIRQIEVVKGPNTALFGANAVSGVINIITYNPLYDDVNAVSVTGGTQGTIRGSAVATIQDKGRWAVRISGSAGLDNGFSTPIPAYDGSIARRQNSRAAFDINGIVQLNANTQFGLDLSHSQTQSVDLDPSYTLSRTKHLTSSIKGQLNMDTRFGLLQAVAYTNWIAQEVTDYLTIPYDFDDQSTVIQLQDVLRISDDHVVRAAFEFRHNEVNTTPVSGARVFYDTPSFSAMWNWTISSSVSWTNAVRIDSVYLGRSGAVLPGYPFRNAEWNRNLSEWSFNSGLVWKASDDDTVRLLVSRGIQLPSLAGFGAFHLTTPFASTTGTPYMQASSVMNYELNWDRQIDAIGALLRGAFFYQKTTGIISVLGGFVPGPVSYSTAGNIGNSDAVGGEISLTGTFADHWRWGTSYRLETIKDKLLPPWQNGAGYTDFQHTLPRHQIRANLGWSNDRWESDVALYYQSATNSLMPLLMTGGATPIPISNYVNADARIGYRINDTLTLAVSGQNLLQAQQVQTSAPAVERRVFINLSTAF